MITRETSSSPGWATHSWALETVCLGPTPGCLPFFLTPLAWSLFLPSFLNLHVSVPDCLWPDEEAPSLVCRPLGLSLDCNPSPYNWMRWVSVQTFPWLRVICVRYRARSRKLGTCSNVTEGIQFRATVGSQRGRRLPSRPPLSVSPAHPRLVPCSPACPSSLFLSPASTRSPHLPCASTNLEVTVAHTVLLWARSPRGAPPQLPHAPYGEPSCCLLKLRVLPPLFPAT